jgi:polyferredoxin
MSKVRKLVQILFLILFFAVVLKGNMMLWLGLFAVSLVSALFFGRFYCGYICPMNTVMGVTESIAQKSGWQTKNVPKFLQSKVLPWVILVIMVFTMIMSKKVLHKNVPILLVLLVVSIIITLRYEQWVFHNHICPFGALLGVTGGFAKNSTKVDQDKCIGCKLCQGICPSKAIKVDDGSKKAFITTSLCHQCQACTKICPKEAIHYGK